MIKTFDEFRDLVEAEPSVAVSYYVAEIDMFLPLPRPQIDRLPRDRSYRVLRHPGVNEVLVELYETQTL